MSMNVIPPTVIMNNVDISSSVNSSAVHILYSDNVNVQLVWTGTPTGSFDAQVSNTATLNPDGTISGGTWDPLGISPAPAPSGSSGHYTISLNQLDSAFVRIAYTAVSGSGHCTATLVAKPV
jgi:hypothetical protein